MKTVLIFRKELLSISETFVQAQANALKRFRARYIGLERVTPSLPLPDDSILLTQSSGAAAKPRVRLYRLTGAAPRFHGLARKSAPALVHAHFATDGVNALALARSLPVPLVVTLHGYDVTIRDEFHTSRGARQYLHLRGQLWDRASVFLCVSEFIRHKALAAGFPENKLRVHHIGIDLAQFPFCGEPRPEKIVLFVGRLVEKKGAGYLIQAMQSVQKKHPDARLVILGHGQFRAELEALATELQVACDFLGGQPAPVVREWMRKASVLCLPSVTAANGDSEGLPIVLLEALAMGTPVVASRHAGIPEAVLHEQTGLLTAEGDTTEIAASILRLLDNPGFASQVSALGRARVEECFDLARQTAELEEIYADCIR